ncbi:MAG: hypothetical protein HY721_07560 [Planctomycetes bacterium]|nr:hypothetical protein [Planctomycetota bacterium]
MANASLFDRSFQGEIPLPLARLYTRAHHSKGERERHDHALHLLEAALKLAASALAARYRARGEHAEKIDEALRHLALPSLVLRFPGTSFGSVVFTADGRLITSSGDGILVWNSR